MKRTIILAFCCIAFAQAQSQEILTDTVLCPTGVYKLTHIKYNNLDTDLNNTAIDEYKIYSLEREINISIDKETRWRAHSTNPFSQVSTYNTFTMESRNIEDIGLNETKEKDEYKFQDETLECKIYNNKNIRYNIAIFEKTKGWLYETWNKNEYSDIFKNITKCINGKYINEKNPELGTWKCSENEDKEELFKVYTEEYCLTLSRSKKNDTEYIYQGAIATYNPENPEQKPTIIGDSVLQIGYKSKDNLNIKEFRRSTLPNEIKRAFGYVDINIETEAKKSDIKTESDTSNIQKNEQTEESSPVYTVVEKQPEFPGGMIALMKYLNVNLNYQKTGSRLKTYVNFVIDTDGSIQNVEIMKSSGYLLFDKEAMRVVKAMPKWQPAQQAGKVVRYRFTLPVNFR